MTPTLFAADYRNEPYWWRAAPRLQTEPPPLPAEADVGIVGSGYTGLAAALELARAGRHVVVFDAEDAGWGCSSRNGGQVSSSIKPSYEQLASRFGDQVAMRIRREGLNALDWVEEFVRREQIECDFHRVGRYHAAHHAAAFRTLVRQVENQPRGIEVDCHVVSPTEQRRELGSDLYHGGVVYTAHASLHPAKFHRGLLERAAQAGVVVIPRCAVTGLVPERDRFRMRTIQGDMHARDVIVATNGYTGAATPSLRRRVIPIGSYIIATEPLDEALTRRLIPNNRVISDTRHVIFYFRLSEDRRRMLFGGRVAASETDANVSALPLHRQMSRVFPELASSRISHSWGGFIAYTFDALPHLGRQSDGVYYCMGYCGSGVSLAPYFGTRLALQLLGRSEGRTALDGLPLQTRPFYTGRPWFLPAAIAGYRLRDRLKL